MKTCSRCKESKELSCFGKDKSQKSGLNIYCKPCASAYNRAHPRNAVQLRITALHKLGSECVECGFSDIRALQIDHVNGGGNQDFKSSKSGNRKVYAKIVDGDTDGYQVLCANCNWIKRAVMNENGHYYS